MSEQRAFERLPLKKQARLMINDRGYEVTLVDISLNGARIDLNEAAQPEGSAGELFVELQDESPFEQIRMQVSIAHRSDGHIGLKREDIGLQSLAALREILEDEYDDEQLQRDFDKLLNGD